MRSLGDRPVVLAALVTALFLLPLAVAASSAPATHAQPILSKGPAPVALDAAAARPALASCQTPASNGIWGPGGFFKSVKVQFFVPGDPALSGSNFNVTPCGNTVPTYVNGFWMNISTDVQIQLAVVTIWGVTWSLPNQQYATPISGFSPGPPYDQNSPQQIAMYVNPPLYETASFYFNDYKNFWPGSHVYFNLSVTVVNATPAIQSSSSTNGITASLPNGTNDRADWQFTVASPWTSNNFSQDISVATTPDVLHDQAYEPNPFQPLQVTISAINLGGGTTLSIPKAVLNLSVTYQNATAVYATNFGPDNHSVESVVDSSTGLPRPLGPFQAGSTIQFFITAWVPWEGGSIDRIISPTFTFNWSKNGGWWQPHASLESNLILTTDPGPLNGTSQPLPTMTPVNVSIHEPIQNVTIGSAAVSFEYHDAYGAYTGSIPMIRAGLNSSYAVLPGLPSGGNLTFSVLARDIFSNTISSANYSYYETGALVIPPPAGTGYLLFEALDLSTGALTPNLPFTLSNSTWSETSTGTPLGFAGVLPPAGSGYLPISYGNYTLTVHAFGSSQSASVRLSNIIGAPIVFYFATQPIPPIGSVTASTFSLGAALGILAATAAVWPIRGMFIERRRKAEAEQKRITL